MLPNITPEEAASWVRSSGLFSDFSPVSLSTVQVGYVIITYMYRGELKGLEMLLSYSQAGPGRKAKQGKEEISRNHIQAF